MGIDYFNLFQPPVKAKAPQGDIIQVIPASPGDIAPQAPGPADNAFQAILDQITGRQPQNVPAAPNAQKQGPIVSPIGGLVLGSTGSGNNIFNFFSEAGFIYVVAAVLVALAFVRLRGR